MSNERNTPPQSSLLLRVIGGFYLVYLAWDSREAIAINTLFLIPLIVFAVVGALLAGHSLWTLYNHGYFRKDPKPESTKEREEETNE